MGEYGNFEFSDFFGSLFGVEDPAVKVERLDRYWKNGQIKEYTELKVQIKSSGYRIFRNSEGKHIVKGGG